MLRPDYEAACYLDVSAGEVVSLVRGWSDDHGFSEQELAEGLASGRLLPLEPLPPGTERGFMQAFAAGLPDGWARDALQQALASPGPMRRFEEALGRFPRERIAWLSCREARVQAMLVAWLEAHDLEPTSPRPPRRGLRAP